MLWIWQWVSLLAFGRLFLLVCRYVMPPLGLLIGEIDFKQFAFTLHAKLQGRYSGGRHALRRVYQERI